MTKYVVQSSGIQSKFRGQEPPLPHLELNASGTVASGSKLSETALVIYGK